MRLRTRAKTAAAVEEERESPDEADKQDDEDEDSATAASDGDDDAETVEEPIPAEYAANARKSKVRCCSIIFLNLIRFLKINIIIKSIIIIAIVHRVNCVKGGFGHC